jgi:polysaccharide biosynthesis transport protein
LVAGIGYGYLIADGQCGVEEDWRVLRLEHMNLKLITDDPKGVKTLEDNETFEPQRYWRVLKRRWPAAALVFLTMAGLSTLVAMRQKPAYEVTAKLLIKSERSGTLTGLNVKLGDLEPLINTPQKDPLTTQVEAVKSIPIFKKVIQSVGSPPGSKPPITPEYLLEHLKIKPITGTDVLQISYQANDPHYATAIVNGVVNEYIASNVQANREEAAAAQRFIASQLPKTEAAVRKAEMDLRRFKERDNIIALAQETSQTVTNMGNLDTQLDQARVALADANARSEKFRRQLGMNPAAAVDLSSLRKSSGVQEVLTKLQTAQSQLAVERTRYRDNHPTVVNLQSQVTALNSLLENRVAEVINRDQPVAVGQLQMDDLKQNLTASYLQSEVEITGLSKRIAELSALQQDYKKRATTLPALEKTQRELERQLKAAQTTYEALLAKLPEIQVAENQRIGNVRVVQSATIPDKPPASRRVLIIAAGSIAGLLLGVAVAFLQDWLDQSLKTVEAVREQFDATLLGVIPVGEPVDRALAQPDLPPIIPCVMRRDRPQSRQQEAYQMLQSNLAFLTADRELRSIVVTSAMAGEGKSEVAINLAVEMAQLGRRVLLVDTNLTHPSLHTVWDLPNVVGLSHVLVGEIKASEAIQDVMPGLAVLTTGRAVPDPIALLDSNRMAKLIAELSGRYDFMIFDASALAQWADASVLGRMADGIVLVGRPGVLTMAAAQTVKEKLARIKPKILGLVVNGVSRGQLPSGIGTPRNGITRIATRSADQALDKARPR